MGHPVHQFLEEFSGDDEVSRPNVVSLWPKSLERSVPSVHPQEDRVSEAQRRGKEEGAAEMRALMQAEMSAHAAACEQRLEAAKVAFNADVVAGVLKGLEDGLALAGLAIRDAAAAALLPLLSACVVEQGVRRFAEELNLMVGRGEAITLELSGPEELAKRLAARLVEAHSWTPGQGGPQLRRVGSSQLELRVVLDRSVIETRIAEWVGRIEEAMRG